VGGDVDGLGKFATAKDLDAVLAGDKTILLQNIDAEVGDILGLGEGVQSVDVDTDVLNTVDILETELGDTAVERHLATLETDLLVVARAGLGTLVTACGSATFARTGTTADTLGMLDGTFCGFEIA
jgi:broad-specificity NMP kinase